MNLTRIFTERILPLKDQLLRVAFSIVRQFEEAEDIVQEVMIKTWHKRDEWSKIDNYEGYCMTMTRNMSIDFLRRKKMQMQPLENVEASQAKYENAFEKISFKETFGQVQQAMQLLSEKQFLSIQLREAECKSYSEIASILNISIEQVKVNIHRARTVIRQQLLQQQDYEK